MREPHPLDAKYQIGAEIIGSTIIQSSVDFAGQLRQRILDTEEAVIRAKLIELGWTPPQKSHYVTTVQEEE